MATVFVPSILQKYYDILLEYKQGSSQLLGCWAEKDSKKIMSEAP